jgi:hypothetical protein
MKYSLRSLMIVVALASVAAAYAGNAIYCQSQAAFHEREAMVIGERLCPTGPVVHQYADMNEIRRDGRLSNHHQQLAEEYRKAAWQPWITVSEALPP